ncbi:hypothetical protein [Ruegeria sp. 6PALISEP08]|uniref:hypothetical protein n=1 Tax=Ruegeria sp. 6PALISEP08 TaxID=1225660 RepID=UPI00067F189A|nr:hypothetical protein [Ruegeria sp. 6PALISEP08]
MLAPDVLDAIAAGDQPDGPTTDYLIKSGFPAIWSDQHKQFAALRNRPLLRINSGLSWNSRMITS